ncbi:superoxide dismutase family protein [Comamonas sp. NoAH]|uniref:superoxide dismutase family protein n=1 Tax=Comamonas halotolerans TaxID=3041496 RepID=UPI0024E0FB22|nr:superoxide dismutase family protein [Comamonas sp. NoAH]
MTYRFLFLGLATTALMGCAGIGQDPSATAELKPTAGSSVTGKVLFVQHKHGMVKVSGQVSGLKPNSEHGFHIHEKGDCSSADGSSAGGHFNPSNTAHGRHGQGTQHAGDLPSLRSNASGMAIVQYETAQISLKDSRSSTDQEKTSNNIAGRALIVHADPDDFTSQPTGNAGARLACAVIQSN